MRKSSHGYTPVEPDMTKVRSADDISYEPSPAQRKCKAKLWTTLRDDPSIDGKSLTLAAAQQICDSGSLDKWWKQPGFREWFLNKDEWRETVELSLSLWADSISSRLLAGTLSDKDLIAAGKLLAEIGGRMPRAGDAKKDVSAHLTPAQLREQFHLAATDLGYFLPAQPESTHVSDKSEDK